MNFSRIARHLKSQRLSKHVRGWPDLSSEFDPTDIAGCEGWFDACDSGSITLASGKVSQWNDRSGNGKHATQITPGNRPVVTTGALNGKDVITFAVDDFLASALGISQPATVFIVFKTTATGIYSPLVSSADAAARAETLLTDQDEFGGHAGATVSGGTLASGTYYQQANVINGASSEVFVDGTSEASGDMGAQDSAQVRIASSPDYP